MGRACDTCARNLVDMPSLLWPACRNVRDLAGLPTTSGGSIRANALIRADSLDRLTEEGIAAFRALGVSRVVDLRSAAEAELVRHPFAADAAYRLVPMIDPRRERSRDRAAERTLAMVYSNSLERNARSIVEGLAAVADAPPGAVVVHCAVGKDRTGMLVALALSLAGVPDEVIAEDYALSAECLRDDFDRLLETIEDEARRAHVAERMTSHPDTIVAMLEHGRDRFGGVEGYLLAHGFGADRVKRLRARLLAD